MSALAACTDSGEPTPITSEARLVGGDMPKVIITVDMTALASPSFVPSGTPPPLEATPTRGLPPLPTSNTSPTPYIGVFLGEPTPEGGAAQIAPNPVPLPSAPAAGTGFTALSDCAIPIAAPFQSAYSANPSVSSLGCPLDPGTELSLVMQRFENGRMFWRDTRQIVVLSENGTFWRTADRWVDGMPSDDPALTPPEGRVQPVRGFGLVWREQFRDTLGWGLGPEFQIGGYWQAFSGGSLFLGDNNQVYALPAGETGQYIGGLAP